jgi:hypothetical protein
MSLETLTRYSHVAFPLDWPVQFDIHFVFTLNIFRAWYRADVDRVGWGEGGGGCDLMKFISLSLKLNNRSRCRQLQNKIKSLRNPYTYTLCTKCHKTIKFHFELFYIFLKGAPCFKVSSTDLNYNWECSCSDNIQDFHSDVTTFKF